jgi:hypothetical protein
LINIGFSQNRAVEKVRPVVNCNLWEGSRFTVIKIPSRSYIPVYTFSPYFIVQWEGHRFPLAQEMKKNDSSLER